MDHLLRAEEKLAQQKVWEKFNEVNEAVEKHFSPIREHVNFTLQKAFHKCAYACFDESKRTEEISSCLENCACPLYNANGMCGSELAKFQEKLNRALLVCQDKYALAKLQKKTGSLNDLVSCANESIQDNIKLLPRVAETLKASLGMTSDNTE